MVSHCRTDQVELKALSLPNRRVVRNAVTRAMAKKPAPGWGREIVSMAKGSSRKVGDARGEI